jgi:hypothetical protein
MTFSGFDNMTITEKNSFSYQKITGILTSETATADNLKIEIPINKIKSATYNKDNKVNKLVMVFAAPYLDRFLKPLIYQSFIILQHRKANVINHPHPTLQIPRHTLLAP